MFYGAKPFLFQYARELRDNPTAAEKLLWNKLRNKKLGVKFRRQHPISDFIVDFYCHELKLVIEVDGGYHLERDQKEYDKYRADDLSDLGITIISFTNDQVENKIEEVLKEIEHQIVFHTPNP
jgi:cyclase